MAEVKWIKLNTEMFDNAKIKFIRTLPEGNNIVLIWVMLLTKAGKCNSHGYIFLTKNIPYTPEMLAAEFDFDVNIIKLALETLSRLEMIQLEESKILISGWDEHQNIEGLEKIREQNRIRAERYRKKRKLLTSNVTNNVTVTQSNGTDIDKDKDIDIEEDIDKSNNTISKDIVSSTNVQLIMDKWNELGLQKIISVNPGTNRYKLLNARIKEYGIEKILAAIDEIQESTFLKGQNKKGWTITFDWFIKPNNFIKVLEGNYKDKSDNKRSQGSFGESMRKLYEEVVIEDEQERISTDNDYSW